MPGISTIGSILHRINNSRGMLGPFLLLLPSVWSACPDHPAPANGKLVASPWQENTLTIRWKGQTNKLPQKQTIKQPKQTAPGRRTHWPSGGTSKQKQDHLRRMTIAPDQTIINSSTNQDIDKKCTHTNSHWQENTLSIRWKKQTKIKTVIHTLN